MVGSFGLLFHKLELTRIMSWVGFIYLEMPTLQKGVFVGSNLGLLNVKYKYPSLEWFAMTSQNGNMSMLATLFTWGANNKYFCC